MTASTSAKRLDELARMLFQHALSACSVERAFRSRFIAAGSAPSHIFRVTGGLADDAVEIDLDGVEEIVVIAAGKGAATMLRSLIDQIDQIDQIDPLFRCALSGVLIAPQMPSELCAEIEFFSGGHPLPTADSLRGARAALACLRRLAHHKDSRKIFCFFLISGGASAMMELPLDEIISLEDTVRFHQALLYSGASIAEINCVRKHFSAVKGGRLGQLAAGIPNLTIMVSDVPAGHLDSLGSGPTLPDSSTVSQCNGILARYQLLGRFPPSVRSFFEAPALPETPKPGSFRAQMVTLLSETDLAEAVRLEAEAMGFVAVIDNHCDDWDYRDAADYLLNRIRTLRGHGRRVCLISVGEVTVKVAPPAGSATPSYGGRNQHFALYAATRLQPSDSPMVILSAGSDGIDGNSPFAGAVVDSTLLTSEPHLPGAAQEALARFDSATFLHGLGATIDTGPTGNNLRDLRLLLVG